MSESKLTPPRASHSGENDAAFDEVLRALAAPPRVGAAVTAALAEQLSGEAGEVLRQAARAGADVSAAPRVGEEVAGKYRVLQVLGRGGMGVVLGAEHVHTGKRVALKWIGTEPSSGHVRLRFAREARAVSRIQHDNVVDVYDLGEWRGAPFLVMEWLRGESLRARIERGTLSVQEASVIMVSALRGLSAVHRAGVLHRDLKPDNIFLHVAEDGAPPVPKLLDFGIATLHRGSLDGDGPLTRTGSLLGTPAYMPLEQLQGRAVQVQSDLYALGVVFYEMLTGRLPFGGRNAAELAVLQATQRPSALGLHEVPHAEAWEGLFRRLLAREPNDRFADAEACIAAIEALGRPREHARAERPRRRLAFGFAAAGGVAALVALVWRGAVQEHRALHDVTGPSAPYSGAVASVPQPQPAPGPAAQWRAPELERAGGAPEPSSQPAPAFPQAPRRAKPIARVRAASPLGARAAGAPPATLPAVDQPATPAAPSRPTTIRLDDF